MQIRTDRGWIKAGLAVLVTGVLGGGVLAAAGGKKPPHKITAGGVTGKPTAAAPADKPFDLAGVSPAAADEAPEADPVVGDKVTVGRDGGSVAVTAVEDNVSAGRLFGAGEGQKYIAAEVKGCSGPHEKNLSFEPAYFLLKLDDGTMHDAGPPAKKPSLDGGTVPAGKCLSGWVTFVVKEGSLPAGVLYDGSSRLTWTVPLPKNAKPTTTTTAKPGATTTTTDGTETTSSTKPKTTATTARGSTATTAKPTTTTTKPGATTGKSASTTTTTRGKPASTTTSSTSGAKSSGSTSTTAPAKPSTTTTTGRSVVTAPTDQDG